MCGIVGIISANENIDRLLLESMCSSLVQRGPDEQGIAIEGKVGLGHRRLSIIDLSTGQQPLTSDDGKVVLVFNGEIYNFKTLRKNLIDNGVEFKTKSDTEVILRLYEQRGIDFLLDQIEGMYAIAIWDANIQKLFVVRDKYGEKPLYYTENNGRFIFASELKAIQPFIERPRISKVGLNFYFSLTYIPAPHTIYEDIYKLEPGHYLEISSDLKRQEHNFYNLKEVVELGRNNMITNYDDAKSELRRLLFDSIEERMVSDVPLGSFLSGGVDSSIVSAIMTKFSSEPIKTFSIGFKEKDYDESDRSNLVAKYLKSDHTLNIVGHDDLLDIVDETLVYFDEPFGDSSAIPSMIVAKKARSKVTTVLTGDCADELFGGYEKYLAPFYARKYMSQPALIRTLFEKAIRLVPHTGFTNHTLRKAKKVIRSAYLNPAERYLSLATLGYSNAEKSRLLCSKWNVEVQDQSLNHFNCFGNEDELLSTFYSDVKQVLEGDMLTKVDRACMINSLEGRIPFLDSKIVEFSFRLPHEFKIEKNNKKRILKESFTDLLPDETFSYSKRGFGLPLRRWLQYELKDELIQLLDPKIIKDQGVFEFQAIQEVLDEHMSGRENHSHRLWLLFVFQKWYDQNFEYLK